ncbi:Mitochondrial N(5)-glutamine methyltransferase MTQ1 [Colletotrichum trifolii]|uniref:Mitochondrial N(5)-glutamine methyltransferase MTQ1 n=1 Tax=Colletotrichum trifolii TaxID=5466 RepID=A0A4R8RXD4_COLTR|nr:Mitochondrial N(5)-glutamine methyltransferase MTQ1 [Colletotrichum trifolii]
MPRLPPALFRRARAISPHVATLLPACRSVESAVAELRWIREHARAARADVAKLVARRGRGEPLQYVLGSQPFGALDMRCRSGVLVPRAETEAYTMYLAQLIRAGLLGALSGGEGVRVVDFCTGTGCIALGLYEGLAGRVVGGVDVVGVDVSEQAMALAEENLGRNVDAGVLARPGGTTGVRFLKEDVFGDEVVREIRRCDVLVSNPPYISNRVWTYGRGQMGYSVRKYEPKLALVPGEDAPVYEGCEHADVFYKRLLDVAGSLRPRVVLFEVGDEEQALRVVRLVKQSAYTKGARVEVWRDWPDLAPEEDEKGEVIVQGDAVVVKGSGNIRSVYVVCE